MNRFSDEEVRRYARQLVLPEVGGVGQERLRAAKLDAASEVEALYLAAAGVGALTVPSEEIAAAARAINPLIDVRVRAKSGAAQAGHFAALPVEADVEAASARAVEQLLSVLEL